MAFLLFAFCFQDVESEFQKNN